MFRINGKLLKRILLGKGPPFPNVLTDRGEELPINGLTLGTLIIGRPGSGKTTSLARHIVEYFVRFKDRAIFVLDWSGSITNEILDFLTQYQEDIRERLFDRTVYDDMGNPDWMIPLPEFSEEYGGNYEEQVQRVCTNLFKLHKELATGATYLGGLTIDELAPQIFRIITSIVNELGETWQMTEVKKLLYDPALLRRALDTFGYKEKGAQWYLKNVILPESDRERRLKTYTLASILGALDPKPIRARVGYYRPGWTPKEAIEKGLLVLIDGARLINQKSAQDYLFTQAFSLIMSEMNKRFPGDPKDKPVGLVMDEVYSLLSIKGMAEEVGKLSPLYRSRKLELYIVLQALSQLDPDLRRQIWSLGNIMAFGVADFDEAYDIAQQLFVYKPKTVKIQAKTETSLPILEPDRGQYLKIANQIQRLKHRECIIRRYESEQVQDKYLHYVPQTKDAPNLPTDETVEEIKDRLLKKRGVRVNEALEVINQRNITSTKPPQV